MPSRRPSLPLLAIAFLLAGPASAVSTTYTMLAGSKMTMINQFCTTPAACNVPVSGSVTLDDDGAGNVTLTAMSLAHGPYQVSAPPPISSRVIERPSITLGAGSVAGTGSMLTSAALGVTLIAQPGATATCTDLALSCVTLGWGPGVSLLPTPIPVNFGTWTFSGGGTNLFASFTYSAGGQDTETLTLIGAVPEPGTALLVAAGLIGMALQRKA